MNRALRCWELRSGAFAPCDGIPPGNRGFRYGMSVFETIALRHSRPLFLEAHLVRLSESAARAGLLCDPTLQPALDRLFPSLGDADGVLRIYITAGEGPAAALGDEHTIYVIHEEIALGDGTGVRIARSETPYVPLFGGLKTANYWQNIAALRAALDAGFDDALLFDTRGFVVSASSSNVFLLIDGTWFTPAAQSGARKGVVRAWVLGQIRAHESLIRGEEVPLVQAGFITNSRLGIAPIMAIGGQDLPSAHPDIVGLGKLYGETIAQGGSAFTNR